MLVVPLHAFADVRNVGKDGLLVSFPENLGRRNLVVSPAIASKIGVLAPQEGEEAGEQQGVGQVNGAGCVPDTGPSKQVAGILGLDLGGCCLRIAFLAVFAGQDTSLG